MAAELQIRFYSNEPFRPAEHLQRLVRGVAGWKAAESQWRGFSVRKSTFFKRVGDVAGPLTATQLEREAAAYHDADELLLATVPFHCWRFDGRAPYRGLLDLEVRTWGPEYEADRGALPMLEGAGCVSIRNPTPFRVVTENAGEAWVQAMNEHIEVNLRSLTDLLFSLVSNLRPEALKVFVDAGMRLPFNAHFAYYRHASGVIDDLRNLAMLFERGLPAYPADPPLQRYDRERHAFYLHNWRDAESRQRLWEQFAPVLRYAGATTVEHVMAALHAETKSFDHYESDHGFAVLEYPHFLNTFIDSFYLAVLHETARTQR